jgi:hypothetical protein
MMFAFEMEDDRIVVLGDALGLALVAQARFKLGEPPSISNIC